MAAGQIEVIGKQQLKEARAAEDDWTGRANAKERRKVQNRLHQRAWRRRKLGAHDKNYTRSHGPSLTAVQLSNNYIPIDDAVTSAFAAATASFFPKDIPFVREVVPRRCVSPTQVPNSTSTQRQRCLPVTRSSSEDPNTKSLTSNTPTPTNLHSVMTTNLNFLSKDIVFCPQTSTETPTARSKSTLITRRLIPPLLPTTPTSPGNLEIHFPLCPDAHLITLVQYNVMRALMVNFHLCNLIASLPTSCLNLLDLPLMHNPPDTPPPSFSPTFIQKTIQHRDWMDTVPCPRLRDNIILGAPSSEVPEYDESVDVESGNSVIKRWKEKTFDEDEMCSDTCGGVYEGFDDCATRGLLVWGDPWLVRNWEVSEGFAKKWGWLLRGCRDLKDATNRWRESRGEESIIFEELE